MSRTTRRRFLQTTSAAGAGLLVTGGKLSANVLGANDRLRIAVIGLNGRGGSHIGGWQGQKNVEIAYVVDPDENVLGRRLKAVQSKEINKNCKGLKDIRQVLEDKNLDAISVATPNHWHSLMTIW
ncbi:MAG: Gfo/Idh/MocA family oxidoreductase, partial [Planctomycetales bacterium]